MENASRAVPWGVKVVLHVRVVGKELSLGVKVSIENIAVAVRVDFEVLTIGRDFVDDSCRSEAVAVVSSAIGHAGKQVVFPPIRIHPRRDPFGRLGVIARYQK